MPGSEEDISQDWSATPDSEGEPITDLNESKSKKGRPLHLLDLPTESDTQIEVNPGTTVTKMK
jgi:hypothetical protein